MNDLAQDLARLSKSLADVNDKLPTYDQRQLGLVSSFQLVARVVDLPGNRSKSRRWKR